jgi:hypothetical protein
VTSGNGVLRAGIKVGDELAIQGHIFAGSAVGRLADFCAIGDLVQAIGADQRARSLRPAGVLCFELTVGLSCLCAYYPAGDE